MVQELDVFERFSEAYGREKQEAMSLRDYLLACRDDPMMYATPARAIGGGHRRARICRHEQASKTVAHLLQPHDQDLSLLRRLLRHGRHDRADRGLLQACRARLGGAPADSLSPGPRGRRQVLARRAAQGSDGNACRSTCSRRAIRSARYSRRRSGFSSRNRWASCSKRNTASSSDGSPASSAPGR